MNVTGRLRWEWLLLVAALVVGVLAMHATPEVCSTSGPGTTVTASAHTPAGDPHATAGHDSGDGCSNHLLTLCLAILIAATLLAAVVRRFRPPVIAPHDRPHRVVVSTFPTDRSPPRTAVRLAQLCVSRR